MMNLNGAILVPCAVGMSLLSPFIMRLYGSAYGPAWPTLVAVVWTAAVLGVLTPVGNMIAASGRMWLGFGMNAGWAAIYVLATLLLVRWGSMGLASSRLIAYAAHATWTLAFARIVIRNRIAHETPGLEPTAV
jgi:O-antigen/teichoic acid export membrane protein